MHNEPLEAYLGSVRTSSLSNSGPRREDSEAPAWRLPGIERLAGFGHEPGGNFVTGETGRKRSHTARQAYGMGDKHRERLEWALIGHSALLQYL